MTGTHDLGTQRRVLDDGRRVTLRHAVPSDAPRLTLLGSEFDGDDGRVALDGHGRIVGHAGHRAAPIILDDWAGSGLAPLLARSTSDNRPRFALQPKSSGGWLLEALEAADRHLG